MNQLTVMLNGSNATNSIQQQTAPNSQQQQHPHQFFTFQTGPHGVLQPTTIQTSGGCLALDQSHHPQQQQHHHHHHPQLVTFQNVAQPAPSIPNATGTTVMLASNNSGFQSTSHQNQQQGSQIQYIITPSIQQQQQQQPNQQIQIAPAGLVSTNLISPAPINMIPVNQSTATLQANPNSVTVLQPQLITNGNTTTLQPTTTFISSHPPQPTSTGIQFQTQQPTSFQVIGTTSTTHSANPSNAGAISINSNQLIGTANGQQFILNQTLTPTNQQPQQIYQLVLPNGQVLQTMQSPSSTNLISTPMITTSPQQSTAITVPLQQNTSNPINAAVLTAPNLTFSGHHQAATFLTTQSVNAPAILPSPPIQQPSPNIANVFTTTNNIQHQLTNHNSQQNNSSQPNMMIRDNNQQHHYNLLTTTTNLGPMIRNDNQPVHQHQHQQNVLVTTPTAMTTSVDSNQPALPTIIRPPASTVTSTSTSTTAMMVFTAQQSNSGCSPASMVLDRSVNCKAIINNNKNNNKIAQSLNESACSSESSTMMMLPGQTGLVNKTSTTNNDGDFALTTPKLLNSSANNNSNNIQSLAVQKSNESSSCDQVTPSTQIDVISPSSKLVQTDDFPISVNDKIDGNKTNPEWDHEQPLKITIQSDPVLLPPASPASSYGSLKIDENDSDEDEQEQSDSDKNFSKNNDELTEQDNFSTETEMDMDSATTEIESDCKSNKDLIFEDSPKNIVKDSIKFDSNHKSNEEKEGYQSSYGGSPCHFTDTEDEEEEEMENEAVGVNGEIKTIGRNRLTQAVYNLINNSVLSGEDDNITSASIDSKCSSTSTSVLNEELCSINEAKSLTDNKDHGKVSIQIQTSATPSPSNSIYSSGSLTEPESTTQNTLISSKEKTIWSPEEQQLVNEIQDFAKTFKLCRLSLGLTQSQVGQELSALGPCYSQSAICRFEKLDITLKSARKIKPVLEHWMKEAKEKYAGDKLVGHIKPEALINGITNKENVVGSSSFKISSALELVNKNNSQCQTQRIGGCSDSTISSNIYKAMMETNKKRKRRTSFTPAAIDALNRFFEENNHPNSNEMTRISEYLNYDRDVVRVWFCNKRQATKAKNKSDTSQNGHPQAPPSMESTSSNHIDSSISNQKAIKSEAVSVSVNSKPNSIQAKFNNNKTTDSTNGIPNGNLNFNESKQSICQPSSANSLSQVSSSSPSSSSSLFAIFDNNYPSVTTKKLPLSTHPQSFYNPSVPSHGQAIKTSVVTTNVPSVATMAPAIHISGTSSSSSTTKTTTTTTTTSTNLNNNKKFCSSNNNVRQTS